MSHCNRHRRITYAVCLLDANIHPSASPTILAFMLQPRPSGLWQVM